MQKLNLELYIQLQITCVTVQINMLLKQDIPIL